MESLYNGRATVTESFNEITISIPTKKFWPVIIFISFWLCAWLASLVFIATGLTGVHNALPIDSAAPGAFLAFWLCGWIAGGLFTLRTFLWMVKGRELITAGQGQLTVRREGALFSKPKTYNISDVKKIQVREVSDAQHGSARGFGVSTNGVNIQFNYGMKTVKFGDGIDEAEALFLLDKLKEKRILTEQNF